MKFLKNHKITVIAIVVFIVMIVLCYNVYTLLVPNSGKALYGNRLDGKETVAISNEIYEKVKETLAKESFVSKVTTDERGRLIHVLVVAKNEATLDQAKSLAPKVLESFSDAQKGYYDFQIIITKEDESQTSFPIIGYKHHASEGFSWTKDRVSE